MLGRLCPRWSAIWRAERPASSRRVATVWRKVCDVAQGKPARSSAWRRSPLVLFGSRRRPFGLGNSTGGAAPGGRRGRGRRDGAVVFGGRGVGGPAGGGVGPPPGEQARSGARGPVPPTGSGP